MFLQRPLPAHCENLVNSKTRPPASCHSGTGGVALQTVQSGESLIVLRLIIWWRLLDDLGGVDCVLSVEFSSGASPISYNWLKAPGGNVNIMCRRESTCRGVSWEDDWKLQKPKNVECAESGVGRGAVGLMEPGFPAANSGVCRPGFAGCVACSVGTGLAARTPWHPVLSLQTQISPRLRDGHREEHGAIVSRSPGFTCGSSCGLYCVLFPLFLQENRFTLTF